MSNEKGMLVKIFNLSFAQPIQNVNTRNIKPNINHVSFCGNDTYHKTQENSIGAFIHQTALFREPESDKKVCEIIKERFGDSVHIVSGACSSGEEAYSYACILCDDIPNLHISGFDIDDSMVEAAKTGKFDVVRYFRQDEGGTRLMSEGFLISGDDGETLTPYQKECKRKFNQHFYPLTKKQTREIDETDIIEEQAKERFEQHIQWLKGLGIKFNEDEMREEFEKQKREFLEEESKKPKETCEVQKFGFNKSMASNVAFDFKHGDILKLGELYEKGSVNVLLYRNALYHTLCEQTDDFRAMKEGSKDIMMSIARDMNRVVSDNGLVVFGEEENGNGKSQGIDKFIIYDCMIQNGFKPVFKGDEKIWGEFMIPQVVNIWEKTEDVCGES